jgi:hypothetical protein
MKKFVNLSDFTLKLTGLSLITVPMSLEKLQNTSNAACRSPLGSPFKLVIFSLDLA